MKTFVLCFAAALCAGISAGQTPVISNREAPAIPFLGNTFPVAEGYEIDVSAAYPVFQEYAGPVSARVLLTLAGALQLGYSNEGNVGNLLGMTRPANSWDAKISLIRQRDLIPSLALWVRGTFGWQSENLTANDFLGRFLYSDNYDRWYTMFQYEFNSTAVGLTLGEDLGDNLAVNISGGYHEVETRNFSTAYVPYGFLSTFHAVYGNRSSMMEVSANVVFRIVPEIAAIAQAGTLPYLDTRDGEKLNLVNAYAGAFGVRYSPRIPVSVESYVRWQTKFEGHTITQFRVGLSSDFRFL